MTHKHRVAVRARAHTLGHCTPLGIAFCRCGTFRLPGSPTWIQAEGSPRAPRGSLPKHAEHADHPEHETESGNAQRREHRA
jgi:hypothetical protein